MTYLGLALLAVGMWGQQHAHTCKTVGRAAICGDDFIKSEPVVVPAVEEKHSVNDGECDPDKPHGDIWCTSRTHIEKSWTCPNPSSYELHQTVDGKRHWCERAPEVAE